MNQGPRSAKSKWVTAVVLALAATTSGIPAQAQGRHGDEHRPVYRGEQWGREHRSGPPAHRRDHGDETGALLFGAVLGAILGAAVSNATQPPPPVVYPESPPPPPPGVIYFPESYPGGYANSPPPPPPPGY